MSSKTERARQYALQGKTIAEIKELVPCSKTTAFNAIKWAGQQKAEGVKKRPRVEVTEEEKKPAYMPEAPTEVPTEEEAEVPTEAPEIPMEFSPKTVHTFFKSIFGKDTWGEYGMDEEKTKALAELWTPCFIKHWKTIVETWGIEIMAVVGTIFILGGHVRSVRRKKPEKKGEKL